tara:strand:- start:1803 stop:2024 length:222 start_codon:yes stop_codon:yes gene_type:complete
MESGEAERPLAPPGRCLHLPNRAHRRILEELAAARRRALLGQSARTRTRGSPTHPDDPEVHPTTRYPESGDGI